MGLIKAQDILWWTRTSSSYLVARGWDSLTSSSSHETLSLPSLLPNYSALIVLPWEGCLSFPNRLGKFWLEVDGLCTTVVAVRIFREQRNERILLFTAGGNVSNGDWCSILSNPSLFQFQSWWPFFVKWDCANYGKRISPSENCPGLCLLFAHTVLRPVYPGT